jgi:mono/diheme cytochrome c family protein
MGKLLLGIILGVLLVCVGAYFYLASGHMPVATSSPEMPFEGKIAGMALHSYLSKLPHPNPAVPEDEKNFLEGAKVYKENCAVCHGLPGQPKTAIAEGMAPTPPQLFRGMGVTDDEAWETYWKVNGGIRMTGMPGFKDRLSDTQMWQVSVLLKNADKMQDSVKAELATVTPPPMNPLGTPPPGMMKSDDPHEHDHDH